VEKSEILRFYRAMLRIARYCCGKPSVRLSSRYRDHIGWESSKIISRLVACRVRSLQTSTSLIYSMGNGTAEIHRTAKTLSLATQKYFHYFELIPYLTLVLPRAVEAHRAIQSLHSERSLVRSRASFHVRPNKSRSFFHC